MTQHSSGLDAEVAKIISNKEHSWSTFVAPGTEPNYDYCSRCGQKKENLVVSGSYLPCKGFV